MEVLSEMIVACLIYCREIDFVMSGPSGAEVT